MTKSGGTICISVPPLQILGTCLPCPPVIYVHVQWCSGDINLTAVSEITELNLTVGS